jgi:hypothetical protein
MACFRTVQYCDPINPPEQGWKKPGFKKKTSPVGFLVFVLFFWGFFVFFSFFDIFAQKREFLGFFSVSRILLDASRL